METTLDGLLDHRVMIEQPAAGYRVAIDTVLLAAAVPAQNGEKALELGCGVGGAMVCLASRVPGVIIIGLDIQKELIDLCLRNIALNNFQGRLMARTADVTQLADFGVFDHVFMNPPYHDEARHDVSAQATKRIANAGKADDMALWLAQAACAVKPEGTLTLIHRADRLDEMLEYMQEHFGDIEILPVLAKADAPPKRVIIRARRGEIVPLEYCRSLVLHQEGGGYTDAAEDILRQAKPVEFIGLE